MPLIPVYSTQKSARLYFVLDWLLKEVLHLDYFVLDNEADLQQIPFFISYGKAFPNALSIPDSGILGETGIRQYTCGTGEWNRLPVLFSVNNGCSLPFDILGAIFFFISRYEEYLDFIPDRHGRYPANESILSKLGLLERPVVDEWIGELYKLLRQQGVNAKLDPFSFQPTYDIDIAFSFRHKGFKRIAGAAARDLIKGHLSRLYKRLAANSGMEKDEYDSFEWLNQTHTALGYHPRYFILAALQHTLYDKNIHPEHPAMQSLIRAFTAEGSIGLHPSYYSGSEKIFYAEKDILERLSGRKINHSRQHYIRMQLPDTYYGLLERGVVQDWSMGYGSRCGFRAATGRSFLWYDIRNERATRLRIHPFCFMDSTAHFEEKLSAEDAFRKLSVMTDILLSTGSRLVTVMHNFSLGSDPQWKGWQNAYYSFLKEMQPSGI